MNKRLVSFIYVFGIWLGISEGIGAYQADMPAPMLFGGVIQFPDSIKRIPDIRMYHGGTKITTQKDHIRKKILFSIPVPDRYITQFTLLITPSFRFVTQDNTVLYRALEHGQPYKFYVLTLKEKVIHPENVVLLGNSSKEPTSHYYWDVKEIPLSTYQARIPDDSIVICYNPDFVDAISGGNAVEFPSIKIKRNILNLVGSEAKLHENSIELVLASLDHDMLHTSTKESVKLDYQAKTIIAITT